MWLKLSNGREELVVNEDHIKRLLSEGAVEITDPRIVQQPETALPEQAQPESEQPDASTPNDVSPDNKNPKNDQRSRRGKSTV